MSVDSRDEGVIHIGKDLVGELAAGVVEYLEQLADIYDDAEFKKAKLSFTGYLEDFVRGRAGSDRMFYDVLTEAVSTFLSEHHHRFRFAGFEMSDENKAFLLSSIYGSEFCNSTEAAGINSVKVWHELYKQLLADVDLAKKIDVLTDASDNADALKVYICQQAAFRVLGDDIVRSASKALSDKITMLSGGRQSEQGRLRLMRRRAKIVRFDGEIIQATKILSIINEVNARIRKEMLVNTPKIGSRISRSASGLFSRRCKSGGSRSRKSGQSDRSARSAQPSRATSKSGSRVVRGVKPTIVPTLYVSADPGDERVSRLKPPTPEPLPAFKS